jgi:hypothetical protein
MVNEKREHLKKLKIKSENLNAQVNLTALGHQNN